MAEGSAGDLRQNDVGLFVPADPKMTLCSGGISKLCPANLLWSDPYRALPGIARRLRNGSCPGLSADAKRSQESWLGRFTIRGPAEQMP